MTKKRGGFTLVETLVAGIILATAFTVAARMLIAASVQRKAMDLRQIALVEAGNVMERLAVEPWPKLDVAELAAWKLDPLAALALPRAKLEIQIKSTPAKPAANEPAAKRVTVIVSYGGDDNRPAREVRLVAWRYEHVIAKNKSNSPRINTDEQR